MGAADSYIAEVERQQPLRADDLLVKIANIVLVGGGVACLFILFHIFYYYTWTGERSFTSDVGKILYYGLPGVLGCSVICFLANVPLL